MASLKTMPYLHTVAMLVAKQLPDARSSLADYDNMLHIDWRGHRVRCVEGHATPQTVADHACFLLREKERELPKKAQKVLDRVVEYQLTDHEARKVWAKALHDEITRPSAMARMLEPLGVMGDSALAGNEESLRVYDGYRWEPSQLREMDAIHKAAGAKVRVATPLEALAHALRHKDRRTLLL